MTEIQGGVIRHQYGEGFDLDKPTYYVQDPPNPASTARVHAVFRNFCHPVDKKTMMALADPIMEGHRWPMILGFRQDGLEKGYNEVNEAEAEAVAPELVRFIHENGLPLLGWFWHPGLKEVLASHPGETSCICYGCPTIQA